MWEDERNRKGGRWLINLDKKQRGSCLDNFWLEVVSGLIIMRLECQIWFTIFRHADALSDRRVF